MINRLHSILQQGLAELEITLSDSQQSTLVQYVELLHQWNQTYNLTAVREIEDMMKRHVIDALSVMTKFSEVAGDDIHVADIGTGGGIPGIILAIIFPELRVSLVESVNKKCRFMTQAVLSLGLRERVFVINERVEAWQPEKKVDAVICRAFTEPERFVRLTRPLNPDVYIAMTATLTDDQLEPIKQSGLNVTHFALDVPFSDASRYLYIFREEDE